MRSWQSVVQPSAPVSVRSPALAKLTRPKLYDALPRPRLFARLDEAATRPIVWVCAPPGAGKTTLVASYLEARGLRHLWYQIDIADSDPATFVHYMRMAALQLVGKKAAQLPHFNPEPQQDLARFARTYFREFFSVLPRPTVIALDSFQEARTGNELRAAFAHALEEVPDGITVIAISRGDPPPEFARLSASRRIARIEPAALACTPDEAVAILGGNPLDEQTLHRVARQSDGWVAALVLLREHLSRDGATLDESIGEGKDAIFQYFAGEIFNRAQPANQRVLMLTAIPPSFTQAEAIALAGDDEHAETARLPLSAAPLHRPAPRHSDDLPLPRPVSRIPARGSEAAALGGRAPPALRARSPAHGGARAPERSAVALPRCRQRRSDAPDHHRERARLGAPGTRADAVRLDRGAAAGDARGRSVARILVRPRLDLRAAAARPAGARARLRGLSRRRRSARPGARPQHDRHRLLLRMGELRAARSLAAGIRPLARSGDSLRCSIAKASCAHGPRTSSPSSSADRKIPSSRSAPGAWTSSSTRRATSMRG